jgi:hypothetical protein
MIHMAMHRWIRELSVFDSSAFTNSRPANSTCPYRALWYFDGLQIAPEQVSEKGVQ